MPTPVASPLVAQSGGIDDSAELRSRITTLEKLARSLADGSARIHHEARTADQLFARDAERSIITAVRVGLVLAALKREIKPREFGAAATEAMPHVGRSMHAKCMRLARFFEEHSSRRVELATAGSLRRAIALAYDCGARVTPLVPSTKPEKHLLAVVQMLGYTPKAKVAAARSLESLADLLLALEPPPHCGRGAAAAPIALALSRLVGTTDPDALRRAAQELCRNGASVTQPPLALPGLTTDSTKQAEAERLDAELLSL